jgi:diguanylate cyclase (GGDEF)-like protein
MTTTTAIELLRSHLRALQRASGAVSVSLSAPRAAGPSGQPLILHEGDALPVPELASSAAAEELDRTIERTLAAAGGEGSRELRLVPSRVAECRLFRVSTLPSWLAGTGGPGGDEGRGRRRTDGPREAKQPVVWIGLRFRDPDGWIPVGFDPSAPLGAALELDAEGVPVWLGLLSLGGKLVWYVRRISEILLDPVTGLPGRAELQSSLSQALDAASVTRQPLALLMVNADGFASLNERLGREAGDRVIQETAARFRLSHRSSDPVGRYGGAIFASVLPGADGGGARLCAEKVRKNLAETPFLDGTLRLSFSLGLATWDPAEEGAPRPLDLVRRAEQALNAARRAGGGGLMVWRPDWESAEVDLSQLSGIFTGEMARDYRNLVLLSHTVTAVAAKHDFDGLAMSVAERLHATFGPDRLGLFDRPDGGKPRLIRGLRGPARENGEVEWVETLELGAEQTACLEEACRQGRARELRLEPGPGRAEPGVAYAIPLIVGDACLGCFYLEGRSSVLSLDSSDLVFLRALAAQLGVALDRARLSEQEQRRQEQEERRLRAELDELRLAIQQAKLVYRSEQMEVLLASVRRVAPTDATVLITGESGTGKELVARTLHELSPRARKPLIVVDCGTIPSTLIESELFGHEKGSYTGAQQRKLGRLAEANGGTVLLDEIGELPLEVQSKLLRFVQEKQFTPVGENRPRAVDVRLVTATNRDLAGEVQAGRFRADLFYRLNVFRLEVPPLRERPDDILYLANHFLQTYALLYHKKVGRLSGAAEAAIAAHPWPGNVRELQNQIARAVILCEGEEMGVAELGLPEPARPEPAKPAIPRPEPNSRATPPSARGAEGASPPAPTEAPAGAAQTEAPEEPIERLWENLRIAVSRQIEVALRKGGRFPAPLGKWLGEDLLLEADAAAGGVASRAATRVGIPESTFRRRLDKSAAQAEAGLAPRQESWQEVRAALRALVRSPERTGEDLLERAEQVLLEQVLARLPGDLKIGSALLGVTAPTYRRRGAALKPER